MPHRIAVPLLLALTAAAADASEPIEMRYANAGVELAGELLLPERGERHPALVVVHGSGPNDRRNAWARMIGALFVERGIAVLLTDKRGSGASRGDWRTAGFDELAGDALAGVAALRARDDVDATRVGLLGLSQGGWIVPLAAARSPDVAFVVDLVGASVSYAEQTFHEMANTARASGLDEDATRTVLALHRATGRYLAGGDWEAYARVRAAAMRTPAAKIAEGYPGSPDAPIWTFLRKVSAFDPLAYWAVLEQPVLVVYGAEDERDNVPVAESERRLRFAFERADKRNHTVAVIPGVGHSLMDASRRQFAPDFVRTLERWLRDEVTGKSR
jgi:dipeptidyl aminopeptidase/acylaminoacyl peptidase